MKENLEMTKDLVYSGTLLIALVDAGVVREDAYALVQTHAIAAWESGAGFKERILSDGEITSALSPSQIEEVFDVKRHFEHVDTIFDRTFQSC